MSFWGDTMYRKGVCIYNFVICFFNAFIYLNYMYNLKIGCLTALSFNSSLSVDSKTMC